MKNKGKKVKPTMSVLNATVIHKENNMSRKELDNALKIVDSIEDPICPWCMDKNMFIELYGSIIKPHYFVINPLNSTELRFVDDKSKNEFYNIAESKKLGPTFDEISTSEYN